LAKDIASNAGCGGKQGGGEMTAWYETFVVEIGDKEIFVDAYGKDGEEPTIKVDAGTDWDGFPVPLTQEEEEAAIDWVKRNYFA